MEPPERAVAAFEQADAAMQSVGRPTHAPIGSADFPDAFALSQENTGRSAEARLTRARAGEIRGVFPGGKSHSDLTPCRAHCPTG